MILNVKLLQAVDMDVQMEFNERLINEVQQQTCLYDCNDIAYKNSIRRNDVWDEIAITLTCSGRYDYN